MKKQNLTHYMILGILSGSLLSNQLPAEDKAKEEKNDLYGANSGNMGYYLMDEDELLIQLNSEGAKLYNSLTPEGKKLAREVASARCNGTNSCKGLNGCRTEKNSCAGQGACKGQSKCAIADPNLAVKLAAKKMAEKRAAISPNNQTSYKRK